MKMALLKESSKRFPGVYQKRESILYNIGYRVSGKEKKALQKQTSKKSNKSIKWEKRKE